MDPTIPTACENARALARLCRFMDELGRGRQLRRPGLGAPELELEAHAVGMSYQELEQYDVDSPYYDPDVGPYYWEG